MSDQEGRGGGGVPTETKIHLCGCALSISGIVSCCRIAGGVHGFLYPSEEYNKNKQFCVGGAISIGRSCVCVCVRVSFA